MLMNPEGSKIFQIICSQSGNSDFPVISSMKGTLWVSRKCFQSFSWIRPEHIQKTLRFLSLRYSADFRRSRLVHFSYTLLVLSPDCPVNIRSDVLMWCYVKLHLCESTAISHKSPGQKSANRFSKSFCRQFLDFPCCPYWVTEYRR